MSPSTNYKFEYVSPTILRGEDHAFLLLYSDALGQVDFGGYEPRHRSGGMIHLLSEKDWNALYPARKGQRDLILQRLIEYSRAHPHCHFIERSLQRRQILRRVGWVLVLASMGPALGLLPVWPWLPSWDYAWLMLRKDPVSWTASLLFTTAVLLTLLYVYRHQRVPPILDAFAVTGILTRPRAATFALAAAGLVLVGLLSQPITKGDTAGEAIRRAEQQYGPEYDYVVLRVNRRAGRVAAIVLAYNELEWRQIELEWQTE